MAVTGGKTVFGDRCLLNIVATLSTNEETFMAECHVNSRNGSLEEVDERADVDIRLLVMKVELATVGALSGHVVGEDLGFEAFGEVVFKLELRVETIGRCPCLGQGETWVEQRAPCQ